MNNFLFICPTFSFLAIFLLASFALANHAYAWLRILGSIALAPGLILSLFLLYLSRGSLIYVQYSLPVWPFAMPAYLTTVSAVAFLIMSLALASALFLIPRQRLFQAIQLLSFAFFLFTIISVVPNLALSFTIYSLGSIAITYLSMRHRETQSLRADISSTFMWHRISDLFIFIALIFIYHTQHNLSALLLPKTAWDIKTAYTSMLLFGLYFRLAQTCQSKNQTLLENAYIVVGILILLSKLEMVLLIRTDINVLLSIIILLLLAICMAITNTIKDSKYLFHSINTIISCVSFAFFGLGFFSLAEFLMVLLMALAPLRSILPSYFVGYSSQAKERATTEDSWEKLKRLLPTPIFLSADITATYIGPFYAHFLLYRFPQFVISLIDLPLRMFHNGSVQRYLLFIIISCLSYYWFWG
jgi:hypothetical protein